MNLNNKKISFFYNVFTFLFFSLGILYIYLADISMGFSRDLIYREYLIQENILTVIPKDIFVLMWLIPFLYTLKKNYSFSTVINAITFLSLFLSSYLYLDEYLLFFAVYNIFALLRLPFLSNSFLLS